MTRHYDELAQVECGWAGTAGPAHILWRGRLYRVRDVLAHWVETGAWWRSTAIRSLHDGTVGGPDRAESSAVSSAVSPAVSSAVSPAMSPAVSSAVSPAMSSAILLDTGWDAAEREVWRVEAQAGRSAPLVVLDVALDTATGQWRVVRSHD
jgi:Family of unknown function (DUF6504)